MAEQDSKELIFSGITIYTDKDFTRAKEYFEKACELNDADGCAILREAYSKVILKGSARESMKKLLNTPLLLKLANQTMLKNART
ncbi:hypothetical protein HpBT0391_03820 [Helicobacter pylori]